VAAITVKESETFYPRNVKAWRTWLGKHHAKKQSVWIVCYKKSAGKPTISWSEAVDEALCFGWIDSTRKSLDHEKFIQFFCRRKPKSNWSKINKAKVEQLIAEGRMTPAGLESIAVAKKNGSWTNLDEAETLEIPADLEKAFRSNKGSKEFFLGLSNSVRKMMLQWIHLAKREETRAKRIKELAGHAAQKKKPKQF
jgi:uncharacterized protein YdeI (YjbR/CyaY-like superfamily)